MFSVSSRVADGTFKSSGHGYSGCTLHEPPCEMFTSSKCKVRINSFNIFRNTAPHVLDSFFCHGEFEFNFVSFIVCIRPKSLDIFYKVLNTNFPL